MTTQAFVKSIKADTTVLVGCDNSSCTGCHAQMFCNNKTFTEFLARNDNKIELKEGDKVNLFLPPSKTILSTVLVFALPLALFPVGYFVSSRLNRFFETPLTEVQKALVGLSFMALAFVIAAIISAKNKRSLMPVITGVCMPHIDVVAAAIMKDGKLFVAQCNSKKPEIPTQWEFPGGKIEKDETPEQAIVREINEELSAQIKVKSLITQVSYQYEHFHMTMKIFLCFLDLNSSSTNAQDIHLNEHINSKWIGKEDLYSLDWAPADALALADISAACWPE